MSLAAQLFKELENNQVRPFYLVVGEEPFQISEISSRLKGYFVKNQSDGEFVFENFDGETSKANQLLASLEMLPGLFDSPSSQRLVRCDRFDRFSSHDLEILKPYFENPCESTVFFILVSKIDKRKSWVKSVQEKGIVIEVSEPYDRDWPKWHIYFEKKCGKKIESPAWEKLVEFCSRTLSLVWQEVQKAAVFTGNKNVISLEDIQELLSSSLRADVFQFADDVIAQKQQAALKGFEALQLEGESEIKILSILVRQFRLVQQCQKLMKKGLQDPKVLGPQLGTHPFFVNKIKYLAKSQSPAVLERGLHLLADADYQMKTGQAHLFEGFLTKYLSSH